MNAIIGKKLGMTQVYENGAMTAVTVVQAGPCRVLDLKKTEKDGYSSAQIGYGSRKLKNVNKAIQGHLKKSDTVDFGPEIIKEIRCENDSELKLGEEITASIFEEGSFVDVTGTVKGRGFQGVVKRYNFGGGRASHGGDWERKPGSVGMCNWPAKIYKGRKMPGHMGDFKRTIMGLKVIQVREEDNLIFVKGAVPGSKGSFITLRKAKKK